MSLRVSHVHLFARDPEGVASWLCLLGGEIVNRLRDPTRPRIDVSLGGVTFFVAPAKAALAGSGVIDHVAFETEELDLFCEALLKKGVAFDQLPQITRPQLKTAFIRGPEGLRLELLERQG